MGALVHFVHSKSMFTTCLHASLLPNDTTHCLVHYRVSLCFTCDALEIKFALVLLHVLYAVCLSANRHPSNVFCAACVSAQG